MPKTRPAYPEQFRREALELVRRGRSIPDVAESLGVSPQTLRHWRRQGKRNCGEPADGPTRAEREELRELRKRVRRLEQERDILKHATAFFAQEARPGERSTGTSRKPGKPRAGRPRAMRAARRLGVGLGGVGQAAAV